MGELATTAGLFGGRSRRGPGQTEGEKARIVRERLGKEIRGTEGITDVTKKELIGAISTPEFRARGEGAIREVLEKAKEGKDPVFRTRQIQDRQKTALSQRPGRRQTILTR